MGRVCGASAGVQTEVCLARVECSGGGGYSDDGGIHSDGGGIGDSDSDADSSDHRLGDGARQRSGAGQRWDGGVDVERLQRIKKERRVKRDDVRCRHNLRGEKRWLLIDCRHSLDDNDGHSQTTR